VTSFAGAAALRLATRASPLARAQTDLAATALGRVSDGPIDTLVVRTSGDRQTDVQMDHLEGQGWFTAELERALLDGAAQVAVHSAKDLPTEPASGLIVAAYLPRADARDGAITRDGRTLAELPPGATIGTGSMRRVAFLNGLYPDLAPQAIRGNVDTRLRKLAEGSVDALVLACAGLDRLGLGSQIAERLDPSLFVPAPAQGAIALECAAGSPAQALCEAVGDPDTTAAVCAERAALTGLGGGCLLPFGAWARVAEGRIVITAALATEEGIRHVEMDGSVDDPVSLGMAVADALR
jgi:hydroxymethylbilane synthase